MSVAYQFNQSAEQKTQHRRGHGKRPSPFCIRLTEAQRARLQLEAAGAPLGAYIKAKALNEPPLRMRRSGHSVEDREALARALALLGKSRIASNLNQLAYAANIGSLPMTPETEEFLLESLRDVRAIRLLLMKALGMKPGGSP